MSKSRNEKIAALYECEAEHLLAAVRRRVRDADLAVIEDACQFAWITMVRREDVDPESPTAFSWLVTIAVHEGWRYKADLTASPVDVTEIERPATGATAEDTIEAREALAMLDQLSPAQAQVMRLFAAGLTYQEIMAVTGRRYTWVNRQMTEARRAICRLRGQQ